VDACSSLGNLGRLWKRRKERKRREERLVVLRVHQQRRQQDNFLYGWHERHDRQRAKWNDSPPSCLDVPPKVQAHRRYDLGYRLYDHDECGWCDDLGPWRILFSIVRNLRNFALFSVLRQHRTIWCLLGTEAGSDNAPLCASRRIPQSDSIPLHDRHKHGRLHRRRYLRGPGYSDVHAALLANQSAPPRGLRPLGRHRCRDMLASAPHGTGSCRLTRFHDT